MSKLRDEPDCLRLREAKWEAEEHIKELGRRVEKGDDDAFHELMCLAGLCCKRRRK